MEITFKRLDKAYHLEAKNEFGNIIESDGSPAIGGSHKGMRPMEMVLSALGSCSSIDVIQLLKKMRQPLEDIELSIKAEREKDKVPSLFTTIHIHYILYGALNSKKVEKAISMSVDTYCSVARLLEKTATISWDYEIRND